MNDENLRTKIHGGELCTSCCLLDAKWAVVGWVATGWLSSVGQCVNLIAPSHTDDPEKAASRDGAMALWRPVEHAHHNPKIQVGTNHRMKFACARLLRHSCRHGSFFAGLSCREPT